MKRRSKSSQFTTHQKMHIAFCFSVLLAASLIIMPLWTALAAGIASVSVLLFGFSIIVLTVWLRFMPRSIRMITLVSILVASGSLVIPLLGYINIAVKENITLGFHPVEYVTFSGDTTLTPTEQWIYKRQDNDALHVALYTSNEPGLRPTIVLLHGGAWRYGNHLETGGWPDFFTSHGYTVLSIEYRLSNDTYTSWQDTPNDVRDAIRYIKSNAKELSVDNTRITLFGQSAGGHLALLEAYKHQNVHSVISLYAPVDLELDYRTSRDKSAELDFIGGPPRQYPDRYRAVSPLNYVDANSPMTLLFQGNYDDLVSPRNVSLLSQKLSRNGVAHEKIILPLAGHSFDNQHGGFATQVVQQKTLKFLKQ